MEPSTRSRQQLVRDRWALAVVCIVSSAIAAPYFIRPLATSDNDDWRALSAVHAFARDAVVLRHELPLRSHLLGGGYPLARHPEYPLFNPLFVLTVAFGETVGMKLVAVLYYIAAGAGTYAFARRVMGLDAIGSAFAGLVLVSSSWLPRRIVGGNLNEACCVLTPLILCLFYRSSGRDARWLGAVALSALAGMDGKLAWVAMCVFILLHAAFRMLRFERGQTLIDIALLRHVAITTCVVGGLGLARIVPAMTLLGQVGGVGRPKLYLHGLEYGTKTILGYPPCDLALSFIREKLAHMPWNSELEVGWAVVALAVIGTAVRIRESWRNVALFLVVAFFAMAVHAPVDVFRLLYAVPGMAAMRMPAKYFDFFLVFLVACQSGVGVTWLARKRPLPMGRLLLAGLILLGPGWYAVWHARANSTVFSQPAPARPRTPDPYHQVRGVAMSPSLDRPSLADAYGNVKRGVGTLDFFTSIPLPCTVEPKLFIDPEGRAFPNPRYRGECYFLAAANSATLTSVAANRLDVEIDVKQPDTLVVNQRFDPSWRSDLGTVSDLGGLLAIRVDKPGAKTVRLRYRPMDVAIGVGLSLATAILAVVWVLAAGKRATEPGTKPMPVRSATWGAVGLVLAALGVILWLRVERLNQRTGRLAAAVEDAQRLLADGHAQAALRRLRNMATGQSDDPRILHTRTTALWLSGRRERAVEALRAACKRFPYDAALHLNLAMCLSQLGQTEAAVAALTRTVLLGYDDFDAIETSPSFRPIADHPAVQRLVRERVPDPLLLR